MAMPELVFDNKNHFVDITNDDTRIRYADTEVIEGHTFRHVEYGIFAADPAFVISNVDIHDMIVKYRDVVYVVEKINDSAQDDEQVYKVIFAYSSTSSLDLNKLNYINNSKNTVSKLRDYYDFKQILRYVRYGFYRTAKLDRDNLPKNKVAFQPIYEKKTLPDGRRPWIMLDNHIGIEVENGIYFFPTSGEGIGDGLGDLPAIDLNTIFNDEDVAAICHSTDFHFSVMAAVEYLAIGKNHFNRLKKIQRLLSNTSRGFYHEYETQKEENDKEKPANEPTILRIEDFINSAKVAEPKVQATPPRGAEELVEGLGYNDLCLRYERPFFEPVGFCHYDIAYRLDNQLVMGVYKENEMVYEYHDLRFLSALYLKKTERLKNGIDYPVIHTVIDYKNERLKQLLTEEAYSLYLKEINALNWQNNI